MRVLRRVVKWGLTAGLVLVLLGWAFAGPGEHVYARGQSVQIADGHLTLRRWIGERKRPGDAVDEAPDGGIPDTLNLPLGLVLLALAAPAAGLWFWDRRRRP